MNTVLFIIFQICVLAAVCFLVMNNHPWFALLLSLSLGGRVEDKDVK